ncbi:MAG TPA: hypothetical protein PK509_07610 [Catalimonadaceae bacterium]|nr:hypothetical protein [Catalimonadaceae bacterium]
MIQLLICERKYSTCGKKLEEMAAKWAASSNGADFRNGSRTEKEFINIHTEGMKKILMMLFPTNVDFDLKKTRE